MPTSTCRSCGKTFPSTSSFESHREGKFDIHAPGHGRRCKSSEELLAAGWSPDSHARWRIPMPVTVRALRGNQRISL